VAWACDWHVCPDRHAKWDHDVLWLLKDADGLDRVRLGDFDPRYLRNAHAGRWARQAGRLFQVTKDKEDPGRIWQAAADLGLPVEPSLAFVAEQSQQIQEDDNVSYATDQGRS